MGIKETLDALKAKAAEEVAKRALDKAANEALDDIERALLGKEGAADEILNKGDDDPLERIRARMDMKPSAGNPAPVQPAPGTAKPAPVQPASSTPGTAKAEREARARAELEALKKKLGKT